MTTPKQWRVRRDYPTTAAGAVLISRVPILREIGMLNGKRAVTVPAPKGKVVAWVKRPDGSTSNIVLFFPDDFEKV
jgi:hypothetical protein